MRLRRLLKRLLAALKLTLLRARFQRGLTLIFKGIDAGINHQIGSY